MALTALAKVFSQASEWSELSTETKTEIPSPILFWSTSATRRRMTPSASSLWMRFQHGVEDSPTRSPISATDREACGACGLQPLEAFPAWRRGQPDAVADLGNRQRGVLLQHHQDLAIDSVE